MPTTIEVPPFPTLTLDDYLWVGTIRLPTWAGFQTRRGRYSSVTSSSVSDGTVRLSVEWYSDAPVPPSAEQIAAFAYLLESEKLVTDSVLTAIFERYPEFREETLDAYDYSETSLAALPEISRPEHLRSLIGLSTVHISNLAQDARSYIGFEFGCEWEKEHGLGVLTDGERVLDVGAAEVSFRRRS